MSDAVNLVSSAAITREDLIAFLPAVGAKVIADSAFQGQLSQWSRHVWIGLDNTTLETYVGQEHELLIQMLGGKPQTTITLEISSTPGSQELAIECALAFAKRWPCLLDDAHGRLYSPQELEELRAKGGDLW